ncbi:hypothetical protein [Thalassiella azotivora]
MHHAPTRRPTRPARRTRLRRLGAAAVAAAAVAGTTLATAPAAQAEPVHLEWNQVTGETILVKPDPDLAVQIPTSRFVADVDLATGELQGELTVPDLTVKTHILGFVPVTAVVKLKSVDATTGTVDLANDRITSTSRFEMQVTRVSQDWIPSLNLVKSGCRTAEASEATLTNTTPIDIFGETTLSGQFDVSGFTGCGLLTPVLTRMMSGAGNTLTITLK